MRPDHGTDIYRNSKTKGGIVGFTLNRPAVKRWILAQSERGSITWQCYVVAGQPEEERFMFAFIMNEYIYFRSCLSVQLYSRCKPQRGVYSLTIK